MCSKIQPSKIELSSPNIELSSPNMELQEEPIPEYYKSSRRTSGSIDYLTIVLDDIRNYRTLNKCKLSYIAKLPPETKQLIIETYNECMAMVEDILKEDD